MVNSMSYLVYIENDHVYVKYLGIVDGLDIVRLTADNIFINNLRRLQKVIHDFSYCEEVSLGIEDMQEIAMMSNIESNFTEKAVGVMIPRTSEGFTRVEAFSKAIQSPDWCVLAAHNYLDALTKI
ncbi:MAG: hypothetical protein ACI936_003079 [Paraglaciecola sp.]|jgi:hypothetical protein